jgi:hypothetical protein
LGKPMRIAAATAAAAVSTERRVIVVMETSLLDYCDRSSICLRRPRALRTSENTSMMPGR